MPDVLEDASYQQIKAWLRGQKPPAQGRTWRRTVREELASAAVTLAPRRSRRALAERVVGWLESDLDLGPPGFYLGLGLALGFLPAFISIVSTPAFWSVTDGGALDGVSAMLDSYRAVMDPLCRIGGGLTVAVGCFAFIVGDR